MRYPLPTTRTRSTSRTKPTTPSRSTSFPYVGTQRLRDFARAPETVQTAFWQEIRDGLDAEREFDCWLEAVDQEGPPPAFPTTRLRSEVEWDERWTRRARSARALLAAPERRPFPSSEITAMLEVPARVYVEALTDEHVPDWGGAICCPLPDHEDRTPSFAIFDHGGWRCYGCGKSGTIYTLAGLLWDLPMNGPGFVELHHRLKAVLA